MLFNSLEFVIFFPCVVTLYFAISDRFKKIWLLLSSYIFYMSWNPKYAILLAFATVITYFFGLYLDNNNRTRITMFLFLVIVFSALLYFKYTNFLISQINYVANFFVFQPVHRFDIVLPVGISFFTFQVAGYLIDIYRRETKAEKNFIKYALFISFFPQLVAGPIERSKDLLNQFDKPKSYRTNRVFHGLLIMLWGFFLKIVIATDVP